MERAIADLGELEAAAAQFVRGLAPSASGATLVTLSGELGAGKTAFAKAAAKALGIKEVVNSPTFVLEKTYAIPAGGAFKTLIHIDAYRLESGAELKPLSFDELMREPGNLILLEWPEKVADALPPPAAALSLAARPDGAHTLSYA